MNAITAHRVYTPHYTDAPQIEKKLVPICINTDSIISIEPIYNTDGGQEGSVIVTFKENYFIDESYEDIISTKEADTSINMIRKVDNYHNKVK